MAILLLDDGRLLEGSGEISQALSRLGVRLRHISQKAMSDRLTQLDGDALDDVNRQEILTAYSQQFADLKDQEKTLWCDLLSMHPGSPNLWSLETTYGRYHTHQSAEILHVLAGEMIFGLIDGSRQQMQLLLQADDFLSIPAGVEHWSSLSASLTCRIVRHFVSVDGWLPLHTGTKILYSGEK